MSYDKFSNEHSRSPSSDEFAEYDKAFAHRGAPIQLEEMAERNFEGPSYATSSSSKLL